MIEVLDVEWSHLSVCFDGVRKLKVDEEISVHITIDEGHIRFTIPSGFSTDGRSGGKIADAFIPHYGAEDYAIAWLIHDWLYDTNALSFELVNDIFYQMLIRAGVRKWRAKLAYKAVSKFGRKAYDTDVHDEHNLTWSDK